MHKLCCATVSPLLAQIDGHVWVCYMADWGQTCYYMETSQDGTCLYFLYIAQLWCTSHSPIPKQIAAFKSVWTFHPHGCVNCITISPPLINQKFSVIEAVSFLTPPLSCWICRNHTQRHKDTITWKYDRKPQPVGLHSCVQMCEQQCHMNTAVWTEFTAMSPAPSERILNPNHLSSSVSQWIHFILKPFSSCQAEKLYGHMMSHRLDGRSLKAEHIFSVLFSKVVFFNLCVLFDLS